MTPEQSALFKSYDIRGTYPLINGIIAYWTGYSFIKEILEKENLPLNVNVMHDHRLSSPELYAAIIKGITDAGGQVNALGLGSTDMLYASCQLFKNAGIMITASHNPKDDNGIKIVKKVPYTIGIGSGLEKIRDSIYFQNLKSIDVENTDIREDEDKKSQLLKYYAEKIKEIGDVEVIQDFLLKRNLKVVVDTGNGMGGYVMEQVKKVYPQISFVPLYWELDGTYPNHPADPINDSNIETLKKTVINEKADFGIAFDGDCDRAFFVDENGNRVVGDFLVAVFGKYFLEQYFKEKKSLSGFAPAIVYNKPASRCTPDTVTALGGTPIASKQGHVSMKMNLSEHNALYGGEHSGHHYFGQFAYMDGGVFAVTTFINMIVTQKILASELTIDLAQRYLLSGELNFRLSDNLAADEKIKIIDSKLQSKYPDAHYDYLDGISVEYEDWKFNIRLSNTEPLLRLNLEIINIDNNQNVQDVNDKVMEIKDLLNLN